MYNLVINRLFILHVERSLILTQIFVLTNNKALLSNELFYIKAKAFCFLFYILYLICKRVIVTFRKARAVKGVIFIKHLGYVWNAYLEEHICIYIFIVMYIYFGRDVYLKDHICIYILVTMHT